MLKTKTITTDKATLFVVELPEMVKDAVVTTFNRIGFYLPNGIISYEMLPEGNWQLLGRLPDITEIYADKFLDKSIHTGLYGHYVKDIPVNIYCYKKFADSISSILQANQIYFENPVKLDSKPSFFINEKGEYEKSSFHDDLEIYYQDRNWEEAQSKVWDKERTYLFIKVD